ncbi:MULTISPECIES: glycerophosphodiester phosphodiesterase family protein [unclassified Streptomyces]|uniref:glycerophosphodiester phosphodiesterase n=1 Tax=unclassified Streptomyces TaxID=2593676 RepID=UPI002DD8797F|nr:MULTISPECIES: glycerophosphodiester phosphodiesterase family protein [unclassified Streptomyces]WSA95084.1 glycerophosphodiester phosphodiesterase family protein [Streptomyces sp. NBC_01795]WSS12291.1 glycerophosphodiester phosphodiesterase family protein [Streptomyces sp. NBC_01186]WSS41004.1 glycerophosphodiester phosphodiesterase family protein [Streptomyces sp. NBC_01187]
MVTKTILVPLIALALALPAPPAHAVFTNGSLLDRLPRIIYTAHRGGALEVPENSMQGLAATYARRRTPVLDVDIRRLRDGTLVAMHDATLNRTTNRRGRVAALDRAGWNRVRLRPPRGLPGHWRAERPPTVKKILKRFGGRTVLLLELKDPAGLTRLHRMLRKRKLTRSVFLETNKLRVAARAHRLGLLTAVWRSARQMKGDHPERWKRYVTMLSVDHRTPARHARKAVRSSIRYVWSHTVNTRAARDRVLRLGFDGIVTDVPGRLASHRHG